MSLKLTKYLTFIRASNHFPVQIRPFQRHNRAQHHQPFFVCVQTIQLIADLLFRPTARLFSTAVILFTALASSVQAMATLPAPQAAALFETARASLPCAGRVATLLAGENLDVAAPVMGDEYLSQTFTDAANNLSIEIGAEDTPIGTQFSATMTISDTTPAYRLAFEQGFRALIGLPETTTETLRHSFKNGPSVVVFNFNPASNQTTIIATMSPLKPGQDTGC
jgi:hypothetical protein